LYTKAENLKYIFWVFEMSQPKLPSSMRSAWGKCRKQQVYEI